MAKSYPYSVFTVPALTDWEGPVCSETGETPVDYVCPTHGDDHCLWLVPVGGIPEPDPQPPI